MATHNTKHEEQHHDSGGRHQGERMYLIFAAMIATSTVVMFLLTYTNAYTWVHIRWSRNASTWRAHGVPWPS